MMKLSIPREFRYVPNHGKGKLQKKMNELNKTSDDTPKS